jgi:hypothetical protein
VRADEKIDPQLELEVQEDQVEQLEEKDEPEQALEDEVDTSSLHFHELAAHIEALIAGDDSALADREWLSSMEREGLALLEQAIRGRRGGAQIFAEDRLEMLNIALAALQPVLARGVVEQTFEAQEVYRSLVAEISQLQETLESKSDAQEELLLREQLERAREGDKPGNAKPKPVDQGEVGDDRPSQLAGPGAAVEKPAAPSQLAGPGPAVEKPAPPSQLAGPGPAIEIPAPPSQLATGGPAAPEKKPQPSAAWDGDERRR